MTTGYRCRIRRKRKRSHLRLANPRSRHLPPPFRHRVVQLVLPVRRHHLRRHHLHRSQPQYRSHQGQHVSVVRPSPHCSRRSSLPPPHSLGCCAQQRWTGSVCRLTPSPTPLSVPSPVLTARPLRRLSYRMVRACSLCVFTGHSRLPAVSVVIAVLTPFFSAHLSCTFTALAFAAAAASTSVLSSTVDDIPLSNMPATAAGIIGCASSPFFVAGAHDEATGSMLWTFRQSATAHARVQG